jgi:small subunit ribosomal protein S7
MVGRVSFLYQGKRCTQHEKFSMSRRVLSLQEQFVNHIMKDGKKQKARKILSTSMDYVHSKKQNSLGMLQEAVDQVAPLVSLKSEKRGMKNVLTPIPLTEKQRNRIAFEWILQEAQKSRKADIGTRIGMELVSILDKTSNLLQKKVQVHKQALANRSNLILQDRKIRSF